MTSTFKFGDIFICRFSYTSGELSKPRPVLALFDDGLDVVICRITSAARSGNLDIPISFWREAGLEKPPVIRLNRLVTAEKTLLIKQIGATPAGAALLHTTIAPTMLKGSPKENVLPQDATAWINYRIAPGDSSAGVMARAKGAVGALPVTLSWGETKVEASPVSSTSSEAWKILAAVAAQTTAAPVAPSLVTAGTDSRYLQPVAADVYRFQPMTFSLKDTGMIHGTNEHLTLQNLEQCVQFYARLIATAAG